MLDKSSPSPVIRHFPFGACHTAHILRQHTKTTKASFKRSKPHIAYTQTTQPSHLITDCQLLFRSGKTKTHPPATINSHPAPSIALRCSAVSPSSVTTKSISLN